MRAIYPSIFLVVLLISSGSVFAQKVTFNVNLKPQLADSIFIPGRDQLQLVGSVAPINLATPYYLTDQAPIDSIYSVTINFPSRYKNQTIRYNFVMTINFRKLTESLERSVYLQQGEVSLDALYFDSFAW